MASSMFVSRSGGGLATLLGRATVAPLSRQSLRVSVRLFTASAPTRAGDGVSAPYFDKVLVANRGEIACRVMKTCKKLGIKTVAIYSEADANALHVRMADEAVCVGPAASSESYLNMDNIINAMKQTGAQALHPGYGFLSENTAFSKRLDDEGFAFIGPGPFAISAMGDKIESKKLAKAAGVSCIPGVEEVIRDENHAIEVAKVVGYPVMIKASAGGGGKGMRIAYNDAETVEGFRLSTEEARSSFNDDRIFIEKFIEDPRHIEIQLIADKHGNAVWLNERECSIQRRNQKVIEEAPSVVLDVDTRRAMGEQAVALAKAVDYCSAGTVEMIIDSNKNFYFLEMNTRLQVEHPVTEFITGLDLVELMIRVAAGHKLPLTQADVKKEGWSLEARVYAEDPLSGFLPSIGTLQRYVEPDSEGGNVRVDTGVVETSEISIYYDPLISKLVTYGATREEATERMIRALDTYVIRGVTNNINFLRSILTNPDFVSGKLTTNFIAENFPDGYKGYQLTTSERNSLLAAASVLHTYKQQISNTVDNRMRSAPAPGLSGAAELVLKLEGEIHNIAVAPEPESADQPSRAYSITVDGTVVQARLVVAPRHDGVVEMNINGENIIFQVPAQSPRMQRLIMAGSEFKIGVHTALEHQMAEHLPVKPEPDMSKLLISPMPGVVKSFAVKVGDTVTKGQELCVIEAMKMQNVLRCMGNGTVKAIHVEAGTVVTVDELLLELD